MASGINRRDMLSIVGKLTFAAIAGPALAGENIPRRVERIGLQLYTVRDLLTADVSGTLAAIAEAGYVEVETAGYAGLAAGAFANALGAAGLVAPAAHVGLDAIESRPEGLIQDAKTVGHRYIVLPWLEEARRNSLDKYRKVADVLNGFGEQCAAAGLKAAYHNHAFEFEPIEGRLPYDLLLERCDPRLVDFELDLFWAAKGGVDARDYFHAWPGRFPLCHVKDMSADGEMVDVGDGVLDFAALFSAGETGGLEHYFIEHDEPDDPLSTVRRSFEAVRAIRY